MGHVINEKGITTCNDKVKAVTNFPIPCLVDDVRSFVDLTGFYRAFTRGFASIVKSLTYLQKVNLLFETVSNKRYLIHLSANARKG